MINNLFFIYFCLYILHEISLYSIYMKILVVKIFAIDFILNEGVELCVCVCVLFFNCKYGTSVIFIRIYFFDGFIQILHENNENDCKKKQKYNYTAFKSRIFLIILFNRRIYNGVHIYIYLYGDLYIECKNVFEIEIAKRIFTLRE